MIRVLILLAAFVLGWIAAAILPPPPFVNRKIDRLLHSVKSKTPSLPDGVLK